MASNNFKDFVAGKDWGSDGGDFESLVDGSYVGLIAKGIAKLSAKQKWNLSIRIKVTEVDDEENERFKGRLHFINLPFQDADGNLRPWRVKKFFDACGLTPPALEDVDETMEAMVAAGAAIGFDVVTKDGYTNTNVTSYIEGYVIPTGDTSMVQDSGGYEAEHDTTGDAEAVEEVEETAGKIEVTDADVDGFSKEECTAFASENGITLGSPILGRMRTAIKAWLAEQATAPVKEEAEVEDDGKEWLINFAANMGIADITDDLTIEEIKEEIGTYSIEAAQVDADEIAKLTELGLGGIVKKAEPKKAPIKKK